MAQKLIIPLIFFLSMLGSGCSDLFAVYSSDSNKKEDSSYLFRRDVVQYARQFKGSKYKYAGKGPKVFDCSGFTGYVMKKFNVPLSGSSNGQSVQGGAVSLNDVKPGDLVFFRKSNRGEVFHVALVVSNDQSGINVLHSTSSRGVIEENISSSSYWSPKISSARNVLSRF